jgi:hypothetical protein
VELKLRLAERDAEMFIEISLLSYNTSNENQHRFSSGAVPLGSKGLKTECCDEHEE